MGGALSPSRISGASVALCLGVITADGSSAARQTTGVLRTRLLFLPWVGEIRHLHETWTKPPLASVAENRKREVLMRSMAGICPIQNGWALPDKVCPSDLQYYSRVCNDFWD